MPFFFSASVMGELFDRKGALMQRRSGTRDQMVALPCVPVALVTKIVH